MNRIVPLKWCEGAGKMLTMLPSAAIAETQRIVLDRA